MEIVLAFACGCVLTWLFRDWRSRWQDRATSAIVRGIIIVSEAGEDVTPLLHDLAAAYPFESPTPGEPK